MYLFWRLWYIFVYVVCVMVFRAESRWFLHGVNVFPVSQPQQSIERRGDETNRRTRAKPQWIVGQAYSHTYSTLSQLSRLQTICLGDSSKFRFTNKSSTLCLWTLSASSEPWRVTPISLHVSPTETLLSSMDSDLEAFSHNPTDGSFTALAVLPTVFTKYLNQLFLSY